MSEDIDRTEGFDAKQKKVQAIARVTVLMTMLLIMPMLLMWVFIPLGETFDELGSDSPFRSDRRNNNHYYQDADLEGKVVTGQGPVLGALVVISIEPMVTVGDFEIIVEEGMDYDYSRTLSDGSFSFDYLYSGVTYYMMAGAAFHTPVFKTVTIEGEEAAKITFTLNERPLVWSTQGTISRPDPAFRLDLLAREGYMASYGLKEALLNKTLTATVSWDNTYDTGGDLKIGYEMTCEDPYSDSSAQYPTSKGNQETITLYLDDSALADLDGCGRELRFDIIVDYSTWANDCHFSLTVSIV